MKALPVRPLGVRKIVTVQYYIYRTTETLVSCNRLAGSLLPPSLFIVVLACTHSIKRQRVLLPTLPPPD